MCSVFCGVVEHVQKEWGVTAQKIRSESQSHLPTASPARYWSCLIYFILCLAYIDCFIIIIILNVYVILHFYLLYLMLDLVILKHRDPWKKSRKPLTGVFIFFIFLYNLVLLVKISYQT